MSIWTFHPGFVPPRPAIPVVAIANLKGGVGKTTLAANLACALVHQEKLRVLAIDFDFQGSLSESLQMVVGRSVNSGAINLLNQEDVGVIFDLGTTTAGLGLAADLSVIQSFYHLAEVEDKLLVKHIVEGLNGEHDLRQMLARKLASPRIKADFDIVIIDTPPRLTMAAINALGASTHILIPTAITGLSLTATITFADQINQIKKIFPHLNPTGIIPTLHAAKELQVQERRNLKLLEREIPSVPLWFDCTMPHRTHIGRNESYFHNTDIKSIFNPMASKIRELTGATRNDRHADLGDNTRTRPSWNRPSK